MPWFRRAKTERVSALLARTLAQIVVFWGLFLFVLPPLIARLEHVLGVATPALTHARAIAVVIFVLGSSLGLASAWTMVTVGRGTPLPLDGPRLLVVVGPYGWFRNPMAIAGMAQGVAVAIWLGSLFVLVYVVAGGVLWHWLVRPIEEADLQETFGEAYADYRTRVPLWLPRGVMGQRREKADRGSADKAETR
jgi:protein-S-isoprenylcysteine O-methyltransferase Ste14